MLDQPLAFIALPHSLAAAVMTIIALLGAIMLIYGVYLEAERKQDAVFAIAGILLSSYAIYSRNLIFSVTFVIFTVACAVEYIQISLGKHRHSQAQIEEFKHPER